MMSDPTAQELKESAAEMAQAAVRQAREMGIRSYGTSCGKASRLLTHAAGLQEQHAADLELAAKVRDELRAQVATLERQLAQAQESRDYCEVRA